MTTQTEDYSPRYVGDTARPLVHTFTDHLGVPFSLVGVNAANMTFRMQQNAVVKIGLGIWTITDAANGVASYAWHANDVSGAGEWLIQAGIPFSDGMQHMDVRMIEFRTPL